MIPLAADALRMLAQRLMTQLVPDAKSVYSMSDGMMVGLLMGGLAREMEDGIERRLADLRDMKALFQRAMSELDDGDVPSDLSQIIALNPASMAMADVNAAHDAHSRALIALHDRVDGATSGPSAAIDAAIWQYLEAQVQRHALNL